MKARIISWQVAILNSLLALLGFTACDRFGGDEYGTPSADYKVRGTAVDEATKEPVEGLRAVLYRKEITSDYGELVREADTVYTNSRGEFEAGFFTYHGTRDLYLRIEDIDGEENGLYEQQDMTVDYDGVNYTGGKGWYDGTATKDVGRILMKEEEPVVEPTGPQE